MIGEFLKTSGLLQIDVSFFGNTAKRVSVPEGSGFRMCGTAFPTIRDDFL